MSDFAAVPIVVVFPIYSGVTHLDFTGPHQVLSRLPNARLIVAALEDAPITADGLTFANLTPLDLVESCDVLCVPGGRGCTDAMQDPDLLAAIRRLAAGARYITSVCTGSLILAAAGLLRGKRAACHWAWREYLELFGAISVPDRVVRDGNILTGGGVTAGIDFALTLVAELAGPTAAQTIQLTLEYAPAPPFDAGRPETAPADVVRFVQAMSDRAARKTVLERLAAEMQH